MKFRKLKIAICMLSVLIMTLFCGCSSETEPKIYTETRNDLQITYTYNDAGNVVVSKSVYNTKTGLTIEYFYYYQEKGWGEQLVGSSIVIVNQDGQIIDGFNSMEVSVYDK